MIQVEVVYAERLQQTLIPIAVPSGATVREAIVQSQILDSYPELVLQQLQVGIFGKACDLETALAASDRVEIYRPLTNDPKEARRLRAASKSEN